VELGNRGVNNLLRPFYKAAIADSLFQIGLVADAETVFCEAIQIQKQREPNYPLPYGDWGLGYYDLLLEKGRLQEVRGYVTQTFEWAVESRNPLYIALESLSLGRAWLLEVQQAGTSDTTQAAKFLQRAIEWLRLAGETPHLPRGLMARATLHRVRGDYGWAERDLAEVLRIATRGGMDLYLADYHLESARLHLAQGNQDKAREHWETAKEMIERMGYHRRDNEVAGIAQQLR
jgi:tetratricopeptide (TPR) repeat protein